MRNAAPLLLGLGLAVAACHDNPARPVRGGSATLAIHPQVLAHVDLAGFGLVIDSLRVVVVRAPVDTLKDTTVFFNPDSSSVRLPITVSLRQPAETLSVSLILSAAGVPLFTGTQKTLAAVGSSGSPITIPLLFTGPGAGVTALHLTPLDSVLHFGDSLRFRVAADSAGTPVSSFYAAWRTSDTTVVRINAFGVLHAPAARRAVQVVVRTLSGAADSTPITFVPTPTQLAAVGGTSQSGVVGGPLPQALRARVTAADGLGVKGIPVQFSAMSGGGSVSVATVVSDTGGYAQTTGVLGTAAGAASFQAASAGLPTATFLETGVAGPPTQLLVSAGSGQSAVAGSVVPIAPAVVAKDTFSNVVPGVAVAYAVPGGRGKVTGGADTTNASGIATVGSWTLDTLTGLDTVVATAGALSRVFAATSIAGPSSVARALVSVSVDTLPSGTTSTVTLRARDQYANNLTSGGLTVAFSATGGSSTGNLSAVTDFANGTYTAVFTGVLVGTADTVHATIGGSAVTSALPTLRVLPGAGSVATSLVTVASATDSSGRADTLTLKVKDAAGNNLAAGGLAVLFNRSGGTSRGTIGATTDHANGTYTAVFTGDTAGTATTIGATIGGGAVTSTQALTVVAGAVAVTKSTISASQNTVAVGAKSILTLQAKDAAGNNQTAGGLTVVYSDSGGTSTATIAPATAHDNGNGTYTDTLTGLLPGTPTTVRATIGGLPVTATTAITVVLGNVITATSVVTVDSVTLASGDSGVVHLQAKDSLGVNITSGGLTVAFTDSGGTSTGPIGATTDHLNGTYTAVFHGLLAGTATTIHATINGAQVTSTLPQVTVLPGAPSPVTSVVTVPIDSVASGASILFTIQLKDVAGNNLTTAGGAAVVFSATGGTSTGTILPATAAFAGAGTDTARFTGVVAGTPDSVKATINGVALTTLHPTLFVFPGAASLATSKVTASDSIVTAGGIDTLLLTARDAAGNQLNTGGLAIVFTQSGGTSTGAIGGTSNLGNGLYRAIFTGVTGGTPVSIGATIGGSAVTSALPTIRVTTTVHIANILADSTWTAVASPHLVHGYLKVANGATLTIQPGAVVKFDTASGLQVGDTAANQGGALSLAGTAALPITLTADSTAIRLGFWKGIEVQRNIAAAPWSHVLIEGAGGTRAASGPLAAESCVLSLNASGVPATADSLHLRACLHGGIKVFGGALTVRRSEIDSATEDGIQVFGTGALTLDTTAIRGSGFHGLIVGSLGVSGPMVGNKFIGNGNANASPAVDIPAADLPHFGPQDTINLNAVNSVLVQGGDPDSTVAAFTLHRLLPSNATYAVNGSILIGSASGQTMTLDSNVFVLFHSQAGLIVGDSAGTKSGVLRSLGTNSGNAARLSSAAGIQNAGDWLGVEFGRLAAPDTLTGVTIQFAGDSIGGYSTRRAGVWVRNPTANPLILQNVLVAQSGSAASPGNSAGFFVGATGGGVQVYGSTAQSNLGFGFAYTVPGIRLVGDTAIGNALSGLGIFTGLATTLSPIDSVANGRFSGNVLYPATMPVGALPAIYANTSLWSGNGHDTLLLQGGAVIGQPMTLPRVNAVPWRVIAPISIVANGILNVARGDSVSFDSSAVLAIGDSGSASPGTLRAIGADTAPILFQATPGFGYWHGLWYQVTPGDTSLRDVTVDGAGYFQPCPIIDCNGQPIGGIYVTGTLTGNLILDSITVRRSTYFAVEANQDGLPGTVVISHSQFYANAYSTLLSASRGLALAIDSSDIYHYAIQGNNLAVVNNNADALNDSLVATSNWWGDVSGPAPLGGFFATDSIGRAVLDTFDYLVAFRPFVAAPYFPVGSLATLRQAPDSLPGWGTFQAGQTLPDSIRVRAFDGFGRGIGGQVVAWTPAPGSGTIVPGPAITDIGGRAGAIWNPTTAAKFDTVTASSNAITTQLFLNIFAGPLAAVHWQYVPTLTQGTVSPGQDTTVFTSSGRVGVILTNAVDGFGNPVFPSTLYFDSLPATGVSQPLATITKETADSIFFVTSADVQAPFQLHATYNNIPVAPPADSVIIETVMIPIGVRMHADTVRYGAICPTPPGNVFCSQVLTAELFDSAGGTVPPNGQNFFSWSTPAPGNPVTIDSTGGTAGANAFVTANANGVGTVTATKIIGPSLPDSTAVATVLVQQIAGQIGVTPDTLSTGIGDTVAFHALVADSGGNPLSAQPPLQWQITSQFPGLVKIDSAGDSLQVRFDSGVYNFGTFNWVGVVRPFVERIPGDTVFGQGTLFNPIHYELPPASAASSGSRVVVDTLTNNAFYTDPAFGLVHTDITTDNDAFSGTTVGANPIWLALSHAGGLDKLFVANNGDGTVSDMDPAGLRFNQTIVLPPGFTPFGITAADALGRVYVATTFCNPFFPACAGVYVVPIDVATDSVMMADTVHLVTSASRFPQGIAFNSNNGLLYVAIDSGYLKVVDPATRTEVGTIMIDPGFTLTDVAMNNVTDTLYVADSRGNIVVVDPSTGTAVNSLPANTPAGLGVDEVRNRIYYASTGNQSVIEIDGVNENFHTLLVGKASDNPSSAAPDPRTGTVYAPHSTGLAVLQFYGPPVGFLPFSPGAPARPLRVVAQVRTLTPLTRTPTAPKAKAKAKAVPGPAARGVRKPAVISAVQGKRPPN